MDGGWMWNVPRGTDSERSGTCARKRDDTTLSHARVIVNIDGRQQTCALVVCAEVRTGRVTIVGRFLGNFPPGTEHHALRASITLVHDRSPREWY